MKKEKVSALLSNLKAFRSIFGWVDTHRYLTFTILLWSIFFGVLWSRMLVLRPDGLYAGHPYVWADWSLHIGIVQRLASLPPEFWLDHHPAFGASRLTYPFAANLISAVVWRVIPSWTVAFLLPSFLLSVLVVLLLYRFFRSVGYSERGSVVGLFLFLLSGGIGVLRTLYETRSLASILDPTRIMTQDPAQGIEFTTIVMGMLVPQRAFLLGVSVGIFLMLSLLRILSGKTLSRSRYIATILLLGFLPIIHTHTFIVLVLFCFGCVLTAPRRIKSWLKIGIPSALVAFFLLRVTLYGQIESTAFFSWQPGWYAQTGLLPWIAFWIQNWGVFLLLACIGSIQVLIQHKKIPVFLTVFSWGIFALANLVQLQPQLWDNSKLLVWAYLGLAIPAVLPLRTLVHRYSYGICGVALLFVLATASGAVDLLHMLNHTSKSHRILTTDELALGEVVRKTIKEDAVVLTPEMVNNPILLAGRAVVMGYSGWVFSYGIPYTTTQQQITAGYAGTIALQDVATRLGADYIYLPASSLVSLEGLEVVIENPAGRIFRVTKE